MKKATPEQFRVFRCRSLVTCGIQIAIFPISFAVAIILLERFHLKDYGSEVVGGIFFGGFFIPLVAGFIFRYRYFRCPVCGRALPMGSRYDIFKNHCDHCDTDYAA